jgi:hypothetical protein
MSPLIEDINLSFSAAVNPTKKILTAAEMMHTIITNREAHIDLFKSSRIINGSGSANKVTPIMGIIT